MTIANFVNANMFGPIQPEDDDEYYSAEEEDHTTTNKHPGTEINMNEVGNIRVGSAQYNATFPSEAMSKRPDSDARVSRA